MYHDVYVNTIELFGSVNCIANANDLNLQSLPAGNTIKLILFTFTLPYSSYVSMGQKLCFRSLSFSLLLSVVPALLPAHPTWHMSAMVVRLLLMLIP